MLDIIQPFSILADIITVFFVLSFCSLHMNTVEPFMDCVKHNIISEYGIHMGVWCTLFTDFVTHAPVNTA